MKKNKQKNPQSCLNNNKIHLGLPCCHQLYFWRDIDSQQLCKWQGSSLYNREPISETDIFWFFTGQQLQVVILPIYNVVLSLTNTHLLKNIKMQKYSVSSSSCSTAALWKQCNLCGTSTTHMSCPVIS